MPLINLAVQHGRSFEEACGHLKTAVREIESRFGMLVRRVEWSADHSRARLDGTGFWVDMRVDAQTVYVTGDIPMLGRLLGSPIVKEVKQIVERTFQQERPQVQRSPSSFSI